jgi:hypothetical protein
MPKTKSINHSAMRLPPLLVGAFRALLNAPYPFEAGCKLCGDAGGLWSDQLEAALLATRRNDLEHGTNAAYLHGCTCSEYRTHQRIRIARTWLIPHRMFVRCSWAVRRLSPVSSPRRADQGRRRKTWSTQVGPRDGTEPLLCIRGLLSQVQGPHLRCPDMAPTLPGAVPNPRIQWSSWSRSTWPREHEQSGRD